MVEYAEKIEYVIGKLSNEQPYILQVGSNYEHPQCEGLLVAYGNGGSKKGWAWIKKGWSPPQKKG